jgi:hypothetical protein
MRKRNLLALISGIAFIVLGVVFVADALDWIDVSAQLVFPVVMIAIGFGVVLGARGQRREQSSTHEPPPDEPAPSRDDAPPPDAAEPPPDN